MYIPHNSRYIIINPHSWLGWLRSQLLIANNTPKNINNKPVELIIQNLYVQFIYSKYDKIINHKPGIATIRLKIIRENWFDVPNKMMDIAQTINDTHKINFKDIAKLRKNFHITL